MRRVEVEHRSPPGEDAAVRALLTAGVEAQRAAMQALGLPTVRLLVLYNACAFRCFFCASGGTSGRSADDRTAWAAIEAHLAPATPEEGGRLLVAGNEPLLHPDFDRLMALAGPRGFHHVSLMSSGPALADPAARRRWIAQGLRVVAVPLYAAEAALHDAVVGAPAFEGLLGALRALHEDGVQVEVHTLALRRTAAALPALAALCAEAFGQPLALAPLRDKEGQFDFAREALSMAEVGALLAAWPAGLPLRLVGFPACVAPGLPRGAADTISIYFLSQRRAFAPVCAGCGARARCPGVVEAHLQRGGAAGLSPMASAPTAG